MCSATAGTGSPTSQKYTARRTKTSVWLDGWTVPTSIRVGSGALWYVPWHLNTSYYLCSGGVGAVTKVLTEPLNSGNIHEFDQVVFGTQVNQLQQLLESCYTEDMVREWELVKLLSQFKYCKTLVVNHHDPNVMPRDRRDWRDLNFATGDFDISSPIQNSLQQCPVPHRIFQGASPVLHLLPHIRVAFWMRTAYFRLAWSQIPISAIDPKQIITKTWFDRVLFDPSSRRAFEKLTAGDYQGMNGIWFVGSWFSAGIPLLEGCVTSAESVVKRMVEDLGILAAVKDDIGDLKFVWEK